jgi:hypothetical protein
MGREAIARGQFRLEWLAEFTSAFAIDMARGPSASASTA